MSGGTFRNPILPGSHPDPSICRAGTDYYLATSTFEYFPGIALHHSRDLVHWRPIGHVLTRPEQLDLDGVRCSAGLYAPTIRYADSTFFVVCTLIEGTTRSGNFLVTASDAAGPWSDPVWLDDADGFDPSLFFDDDGAAWYCSTSQYDPTGSPGSTTVRLQRLDLDAGQLVGERHAIWRGALRGARWAEAPHIFKIAGRYYLVAAEGGTWLDHAVVAARSDRVTGPYESCPRNPVLTARMAGARADIVATGHADLVQTPAGDWWAVLLGVRPLAGSSGNLGRETFLTPVEWDADGWPLFGTDGRVLTEERRPALDEKRWPASPRPEAFATAELGPTWLFLRTPRERWWTLSPADGTLRLRLRPPTLEDRGNASFVGRRQQHHRATAYTIVDVVPTSPGECAGLAVLHSDDNHFRLEVAGVGDRVVRLLSRAGGVTKRICQRPAGSGRIGLGVEIDGSDYTFVMRDCHARTEWQRLGTLDGSALSYSTAGGFFGTVIGMYATSSGADSTTEAAFGGFDYAEVPN